ncbi:hypothetical protein HNQ07_004086 [Deinococcus metalli]|uniref:Uncharacterized protein n=1 Tax=Deinococcus metalli TaxID=1141878 RepID=A0A7W8KI04_9DEIO|nr:hypothetical protein [Deinococcus metalli]MBB5378579.1 hypothetical protein [Deinococcus metalli]GHF58760.1 hypothetical protein GCM10017781_38820 [Deinococcus metalli]
MSLRLLNKAAQVEQDPELHMARLLILLNARSEHKPVAGIMKLAKLDFLLRYPVGLERALKRVQKKPVKFSIREFERSSVESKMIRFKYGPWDGRYRQWIGLLVAKGLASTHLEGRTVMVELTAAGHEAAERLAALEEFADMAARSVIVQKQFGNMSATRIKNFVYETFPELVQMKWGEEIDL